MLASPWLARLGSLQNTRSLPVSLYPVKNRVRGGLRGALHCETASDQGQANKGTTSARKLAVAQ